MKIAVQLDDNRNIVGTVTTNELGAELQVKLFKDKGWVLVDSDPTFSSAESYLWTIRESDNKLVHISTGKTPDEESQSNITQLTQSSLDNKMTGVQLQAAVTALTQSNLQLTMDNAQLKSDRDTSQKAITELTTKFLTFQMSNTQATTPTK